MLEETFSVTEDRFGELVTVDLKPGGSDIPVTEENKREYVDLAVHYRIVGRVKEQFGAFIDGFFEVVSKSLIAVFDERELELLIGGMTDIDMCVSPKLAHLSHSPFFFSQGRLVQVHRLPRVRQRRPSHLLVLADPSLLASGTESSPSPVHHRYLQDTSQRLQGPSRL